MEVSGRIKLIGETKEFGNNGFRKREIVVTTNEQYPQHIMIEFTQDRCNLLDSYKEGDEVKIDFNLRGREWVNPEGEAKYFNSLNGWRIDKLKSDTPPPMAPPDNIEFIEPSNEEEEDYNNDLPF